MSFTMFSVIIIAITVMLILGQIYRGYKKGLSHSLVNLASTVLSTFFAVLISTALASLIEPEITEWMSELEFYANVLDSVGNVVAAMAILTRMIIALLLYLPVFFVLRLVINILVGIICSVALKKKGHVSTRYYKENEELYIKKHKKIGAFVGAFTGVILTVVIFTPLVSAVGTAVDVVEIAANVSEDNSWREADEIQLIEELSDDASVRVIGILGADMLSELVTTVEVDGHRSSLEREVAIIKGFDMEYVEFVLTSMNTANAESVDYLASLLDYIDDSVVLRTVLVVYISDASDAWMKNEAYLEIERPMFKSAAINSFFNEILYVCSSTTLDTVDQDTLTLMNLNRILYESKEVLDSEDYKKMIIELIDNGTVGKMKTELDKNPHMQSVSFAVDDMVMTIVSDELRNTMKYSQDECDALFADFADILTSTQGLGGSVRQAAVSADIKDRFEDYGIYVPDDFTETIAEMLISGTSDSGTYTDFDDVESFFDKYQTLSQE